MFGLGWTPCIGPTLGAVQTLALIEASAARGAILSLFYCIGLGAPFIFFALFLERSNKFRRYLIQRGQVISIIGGVFLISIGLLQVFGLWEYLMASLRGTISSFIPVI
jgi:cytochrome c-type biogenesis protein